MTSDQLQELAFSQDMLLLKDGTVLTVRAGVGTFCLPEDRGPYTHFEVVVVHGEPDPVLTQYRLQSESIPGDVLAYVPADVITHAVYLHGEVLGRKKIGSGSIT